MSKNFELLQQVGRNFKATSIPQPRRVLPKVNEKAHRNGARLELGQVAREETSRTSATHLHSQPPPQPLTSGVWSGGKWSSNDQLSPMEKIQLKESDVVSFHSYDKPETFEARILSLQHFHRPIICTEYMARENGSTFQESLPIAKKYRVGAINWGLVAGKTQTYFPWDSWQHPYTDHQPPFWFHDIFLPDGQPYRQDEVDFIRRITGHEIGQTPNE